MKHHAIAKLSLLLALLLTACQGGTPATDAPAATSAPTNTALPTDTPLPTVTPTRPPLPTQNPFDKGTGTLQSGNGRAEVDLKIVNNTDELLLINWINFEGQAESFTQVGPQSATSIGTYSTHAWQVVDKSGNVISEFVATSEKRQVFEIGSDLQVVYQPTPLPAPTFGPDIPASERAYADRPDDYPDLYQFHVLYVIPADAKDRQMDTDGTIARSVDAVNEWFSEQSGGSTVRFDTYQGQLDITFVQLEMTNREFLDNTVEAYGSNVFNRDYLEQTLDRMRVFRPGKIYVAFFDVSSAPNACADASHFPDLPGRLAGMYPVANNAGYSCTNDHYGVGDPFGDMGVIHEMVHSLGFAAKCSKNHASADNISHTGDDYRDLMWAPSPGYSGPWWDAANMQLDPGNDDYYNHNIPNCPDLAKSAFLEPVPEDAQLPVGWPEEWKLP
ncbi:MAG: hypothetical protein H6634_12720 [Anaerolineales bacterium]|nr:hypothetical protein [Anaerolineales bacterium]MCB9112097.1 hypothetical protein [Anaerolineales bacterium]